MSAGMWSAIYSQIHPSTFHHIIEAMKAARYGGGKHFGARSEYGGKVACNAWTIVHRTKLTYLGIGFR